MGGAGCLKRYGRILKLKPEYEAEYKKYHEDIWQSMKEAIHNAGVSNYSIYLHNGFLFAYMEMMEGKTLESACLEWSTNEACQKWDEIMCPMQQPVEGAKPDEWWVEMEEVFHQD